jgi:hypothetical protein
MNLFAAAGHGDGLQIWSYTVVPEQNEERS